MASCNLDGRPSFAASEAMEWRRAAKYGSTAGQAGYAGAGDRIDGIVQDIVASGDDVALRTRNSPGDHIVTVDGEVSVGQRLYAAASGKLSATQCGPAQMVALEAATADGNEIRAAFLPEGDRTLQFTVKTASYTVTRQESGAVFSNLGAAGAVTFTLPQDAIKGDYFTFVAQTAQEVRVDPGAAGAIYVSGAKQTDDAYVSFDDEAEHITVVADGNGDWVVINSAGTLTVV
jgi:hypothetical protein